MIKRYFRSITKMNALKASGQTMPVLGYKLESLMKVLGYPINEIYAPKTVNIYYNLYKESKEASLDYKWANDPTVQSSLTNLSPYVKGLSAANINLLIKNLYFIETFHHPINKELTEAFIAKSHHEVNLRALPLISSFFIKAGINDSTIWGLIEETIVKTENPDKDTLLKITCELYCNFFHLNEGSEALYRTLENYSIDLAEEIPVGQLMKMLSRFWKMNRSHPEFVETATLNISKRKDKLLKSDLIAATKNFDKFSEKDSRLSLIFTNKP